MTEFKEGDLVKYNPDRLFDADYRYDLLGLVVEISHLERYHPVYTVIGVSWPDGYMEEDPEDLLKVTEDDSV